jgi:hypothetical protein
MRPATEVVLSDAEREQLQALLRARGSTVAEHLRARIILLAAEGHSTEQIAREVGVPACTVSSPARPKMLPTGCMRYRPA